MSRTCICGHPPLDHRVIDVAERVAAGVIDPSAPPRELRVMRSWCGSGCRCILYTPTDTLRRQAEAAVSQNGGSLEGPEAG